MFIKKKWSYLFHLKDVSENESKSYFIK
jgi:hypothetical protein